METMKMKDKKLTEKIRDEMLDDADKICEHEHDEEDLINLLDLTVEKALEAGKKAEQERILEICLIVFATIVFFWSVLK